MKRIAVGTDRRGEEFARHVVDLLTNADDAEITALIDGGESGLPECVDYPEVAWRVASAVASGEADGGILISGSGIGMCMSANKYGGIRAVIAHDEWIVRRARVHHDCNMLCIPADLIGLPSVQAILDTWLKTGFEGGRHERRVKKIGMIERGEDPAEYAVEGGH